MAKYATSINNLYQKYTKRGFVGQFWGPHNVGKHTFLGKYFHLHMSFGLPGPLGTPFELSLEPPKSKFTPDAATLTLHALVG